VRFIKVDISFQEAGHVCCRAQGRAAVSDRQHSWVEEAFQCIQEPMVYWEMGFPWS